MPSILITAILSVYYWLKHRQRQTEGSLLITLWYISSFKQLVKHRQHQSASLQYPHPENYWLIFSFPRCLKASLFGCVSINSRASVWNIHTVQRNVSRRAALGAGMAPGVISKTALLGKSREKCREKIFKKRCTQMWR